MVSTEPGVVSFPRRAPGQVTPPDGYAELRARPGLCRTVLPGGTPVWLVARHEDVRAALTDPRLSSDPSQPGFPATGGAPEALPGWFVAMDAPEHTRYRKLLIPEFTVRKVRELRPGIQQVVDERIDAMLAAGNSADLVSAFCLVLPSLVICQLLGVPYEDHEHFESRTRVLVSLASTARQRETALGEINTYLAELIAAKRERPGEDLISRLIDGGALDDAELLGVAMLLLVAGHETTANMLSLGVVTLLENPQWIGHEGVVEELLRFFSISDVVSLRVATEDLEISGQLIRRGEGVAPLGLAAGHDGTVFEDAGEFCPARSARHHVAFGYGIHQCIGQHLARLEMDVALTTLFERVPRLRLAVPADELEFKHDGVLFGLYELPVRW
ncbi:cytochrome P450 monooxygenase [Amycolatopsis lexingtonensis]|uniref:Cytochrome P450 monooxygenase n=1 Tax=Amycolatopsis lexingtonensis TaxID=218822 RepID=A0ABR9I061_9PSEU|nr:cytochrome P450 [Amycolatopsis lexingtonensis]MBE1496589.1 cytochrome P450 monooxygenase [Amycolatopsis lexingtonensis]